jgi:hypothetical protein
MTFVYIVLALGAALLGMWFLLRTAVQGLRAFVRALWPH